MTNWRTSRVFWHRLSFFFFLFCFFRAKFHQLWSRLISLFSSFAVCSLCLCLCFEELEEAQKEARPWAGRILLLSIVCPRDQVDGRGPEGSWIQLAPRWNVCAADQLKFPFFRRWSRSKAGDLRLSALVIPLGVPKGISALKPWNYFSFFSPSLLSLFVSHSPLLQLKYTTVSCPPHKSMPHNKHTHHFWVIWVGRRVSCSILRRVKVNHRQME